MRLWLPLAFLVLASLQQLSSAQKIQHVTKTYAVYCARFRRQSAHFCAKDSAELSSRAAVFCRQYASRCEGGRPRPRRLPAGRKRAARLAQQRRRLAQRRAAESRATAKPSTTTTQRPPSSGPLGRRRRGRRNRRRRVQRKEQAGGMGNWAKDLMPFGGIAASEDESFFANNGEEDDDDGGLWGDEEEEDSDPWAEEDDSLWGEPLEGNKPYEAVDPFATDDGWVTEAPTTPAPVRETTPRPNDGTVPEAAGTWCERYASLGRRICDSEIAARPNYQRFCQDYAVKCAPFIRSVTEPEGLPESFNPGGLLGEEYDPFEGIVDEPEIPGEPTSRRRGSSTWDEDTGLGVQDLITGGGIAPSTVDSVDRVGFGQFYGQETTDKVDWGNGVYGQQANYGVPMFGDALMGYDNQQVEVPVFNGELGAPIKAGRTNGFGAFWRGTEGQNIDWMGGKFEDGQSWGVPFIEHTGSQKFGLNYGDGVNDLITRYQSLDEQQRAVDEIIRRQRTAGTLRSMNQ